jgi:glycosyltransferase involved in cell wall biosynthesis
MGGGERYMLYLAATLSNFEGVKVTILNEFPEITKHKMEEFFSLDLSKIDIEIVRNSLHSLRQFVNSSDIFIPLSNFRKINAKPQKFVQALQIPYDLITPLSISRRILRGNIKEGIKDILRLQLLSYTKRCSLLTLTNSHFVHDTLLRNFGIQSEVLYPPIQDFLIEGATKRKIILSVGRFFRGLYNDKRYDLLTETFRKVSKEIPDWEYHLVGSASSDDNTKKLLYNLKRESAGFPIFFHVNDSYESLRRLYNVATVFWHGTGYGIDETRYPEKTEHFGMSVAEAMTAKCIPVVVNRGGLREIVHHGTNGFLWETTEELINYTINAVSFSPQERDSIARQARERSMAFSTASFEERVKEIFAPLL